MAIIKGIESIEFGVDDIPTCIKFLTDFGLNHFSATTTQSQHFSTLSGAKIILHSENNPDLPTAFDRHSKLRCMTWSVGDQQALSQLRQRLKNLHTFVDDENYFMCRDPNGMPLKFSVTQQQSINLRSAPMNQWGDIRRIDQASPIYDKASPINIGHIVFFVEDLAETEAFYREKLGFYVSDRYINRAVFLRCNQRGFHHDLFLLRLPHAPRRGLNHIAFNVRDIHEVIGGGLAMNKHHWSTFIGPGRHPISSAYFWYINSPMGGAFEYYTNDDYITEQWQPRELEHSLTSFTEWAIEGGLDYQTRRQVKLEEAT